MDILKKMFDVNKGNTENKNSPPSKPNFGDEFRKPIWFDDCETDDELFDNNAVFGFQIFTNPLEMQKHFEQQMQEMLKTLDQFEGNGKLIDEDIREDYMKPGFENFLPPSKEGDQSHDTDLDGEIYADQLHSLLQRISPEMEAMMPKLKAVLKNKSTNSVGAVSAAPIKRSDEEAIWDRIHGTYTESAGAPPAAKPRHPIVGKQPSRSGVFEGAFQGPKVFRQSIMTQIVRKPDGSYETRRTVLDANGHTNTVVTRTMSDGRTETLSSSSDGSKTTGSQPMLPVGDYGLTMPDRNIYVTKDGYAMPKNIW